MIEPEGKDEVRRESKRGRQLSRKRGQTEPRGKEVVKTRQKKRNETREPWRQ